MRLLILLCLSLSAFGQASGATITAKSGELRDVQAAVKKARDGDTVVIPRGTWTWKAPLRIDGGTFADQSHRGKSVSLHGEGGVKILNDYVAGPGWQDQTLIYVMTGPAAPWEMKGIDFAEGPALAGHGSVGHCYIDISYAGGSGQTVNKNGKVAIIGDCSFESRGNVSWMVHWPSPPGLIYNCKFSARGTGSEVGIEQNGGGGWTSPSTMGTADKDGLSNLYVEDCSFSGFGNGYACDLAGGSRMVIRHCTFNNSLVGSHGYESDPAGMRHAEVYDCKFEGKSYTWLHIRGGTWAVFDNDFATGTSAVTFTLIALQRRAVQLNPPCPTKYPIPRQIGQGWAKEGGSAYPGYESLGNGYVLDPCYFWNNKGFTVGYTDDQDTCGNRLQTKDFVKEGRDYYIDRPKPGYAPYPYPHPLRATSPNRRQNRN
jgi:hypothetical protein